MSKIKIKKRRIFTVVSLSILFVIAIVCAIYLGDYYRADEDAIAAFGEKSHVSYSVTDGDDIVFYPDGARTGVIFYPGGKVEYTAYIPLMQHLAEEGIMTALLKMPFNLAVLDVNAAGKTVEAYPEIEEWYIGGHSLGGSMAASYLEKNPDTFKGLLLLGSYSTADISSYNVSVLSVYGSEDGVMNRVKYENSKANLPKEFSEIVIDGGCHAYFGLYGEQDGDGVATISPEQQINETARLILDFIKNG